LTCTFVNTSNHEAAIHPLAQLLRGFAIDFLTAHNNAVVERIMAPSYRLNIYPQPLPNLSSFLG
jgi:hypothetical protein